MTIIRSLLFALLFGVPLQQGAQTGSIQGTAIDAATRQPLKDTSIYLRRVEGQRGAPRQTTTDEKGGFRIGDVEPGRYQIVATRHGYLAPPPADVVVEAGGPSTVSVSLMRGGSIAGRIYDTNREPVEGAEVQLSVLQYGGSGQRRLETFSFQSGAAPNYRAVQTDARGEYRFIGPQAGDSTSARRMRRRLQLH
jgi:hypothetical protein